PGPLEGRALKHANCRMSTNVRLDEDAREDDSAALPRGAFVQRWLEVSGFVPWSTARTGRFVEHRTAKHERNPRAIASEEMNQTPGIIGKKLGMTHLYKEDGTVQRVTVVDTSSVVVVGKRTKEKDGYTAVVFGLRDAKEKHLTKAQAGSFKKANVALKREL